jgi:hypothetical protein
MNLTLLAVFIFLNGEFAISTAIERQWKPVVAFDGEKYLVVWEDTRKTGDHSDNDIWGQFVSKEGSLIDTNFPICLVDSGQWKVDIAFGDSSYLVVWSDDRDSVSLDIYGQLVSRQGQLIGSSFVVSAETRNQTEPDVIYGSTDFLVVWQQDCIRGQLVSSDGDIVDTGLFVCPPGGQHYYPQVGYDGMNYLVVWRASEIHGKMDPIICGQIVDPEGMCVDTYFLAIDFATRPALAFDGTNYFVTAERCLDSILGQFVSPDRKLVGDPFLLASQQGSTRGRPRVAWDGTDYLAVWWEGRNGSDGDTYGQWVSSSGSLVDTNFAVMKHPSAQDRPAIATDGTNCLVVWCDGRNYGDHFDVFGRIVSRTAVEEKNNEQLSIRNSQLTVAPNPFTQNTVISYQSLAISKDSQPVTMSIYDMSGRSIGSLNLCNLDQSVKSVVWDAHNVPAGIYFLEFRDRNIVKRQKLVKVEVK